MKEEKVNINKISFKVCDRGCVFEAMQLFRCNFCKVDLKCSRIYICKLQNVYQLIGDISALEHDFYKVLL